MKRLKISRGGQISIPAAVRHRWGGSTLTLEDRGDELVIRPAPDDPVTALRGRLADTGTPSADLRRVAREDERAAERSRAAE